MAETAQQAALNPTVVLGVAAHPDDLDFGMAGTMAKWAAGGAAVYYLILTNGNKGSSDPAAVPDELRDTRRAEQRAAAAVVGARDVYFCDYDDGALECCSDVKRDIARVIRQVRPEVVLTMDPSVLYDAERGFINHPDHRAAGQSTLDAVYPLARDHLSFPELLRDEGLQPHKVATVLLVNFQAGNHTVDISDHLETKLRALAAHKSQIPNMQATGAMLTDMAARAGQKIGVRYGERFVRIDIR